MERRRDDKERRRDDRIRRRIQVTYYEPGESTHRHKGFTTDVSASGMFIATAHPLHCGCRVRIEFGGDERGFLVEGQVTHAFKTDPLVPSPRRAGMGVRFLPIKQLLGKLVPEIAAVPEAEAPVEDGVYRVFYEDRQSFLEIYRRDLSTGGLFVATDHPAQVDEVVVVELVIAGSGQPALRFEGKVVYRVEPTIPEDEAATNLMAGMGIELVDFQGTSEKLASLVRRLA
jgi:Tfp pilus assembly protein PilZ